MAARKVVPAGTVGTNGTGALTTTSPVVDAASTGTPLGGSDADHLVNRLRRVQGQVGGLIRMIETGRDCGDVVTQLAAATRALERVGFLLLASELRRCTSDASSGDVDGDVEARTAALEKLFLTLG